MLILGQVRLSKGQLISAGLGKESGQGPAVFEPPAGARSRIKTTPQLIFSNSRSSSISPESASDPNVKLFYRDKEQCANIRGYVNSCSIGDWYDHACFLLGKILYNWKCPYVLLSIKNGREKHKFLGCYSSQMAEVLVES